MVVVKGVAVEVDHRLVQAKYRTVISKSRTRFEVVFPCVFVRPSGGEGCRRSNNGNYGSDYRT